VHLGEGSDEYKKPQEFFRRTFMTVGMQKLLSNALKRLTAGAAGVEIRARIFL
jgi:predicted AAA+ superfamily ATPase